MIPALDPQQGADFVSPQNLYVEIQMPSMLVFGGKAFGRCMGHKGKTPTYGISAHLKEISGVPGWLSWLSVQLRLRS